MNFFCTFNVSAIKYFILFYYFCLCYTSHIITEIVTRDMDSNASQPFIKPLLL